MSYTVFLNEEPRAIGTPDQIARVVATMRQQGIAALDVYDHATADGYALVRLPLRLFAGDSAQRQRIVADAPPERRAVATAEEAPDGCTCFLTAPCSFCTRFADRDLPEE